MSKVDKLTKERKNFLEQLYSLIYLEFEDQKDNKEKDEYEKIRTISINATWGMGKSLFAEALEEHILDKNSKEFKIEVLKYNAWQNDCFSDPMKTIIGELNEQLTLSSELKEKAEIVLKNIAKKGLKTLFEIMLKNFKMTDKDIENLKELFTGINESSLAEYKEYKKMINDFKIALSEEAIIGTSFKPKVILVDELDRCRPDFAIEVLETIKHIFDVNNIIFIFLINKSQLKSSVSNIYGEDYGNEDYFKKFFNLELNLPKLNYQEYKKIEYSYLEEEAIIEFKEGRYIGNLNEFNKNLFLNCLKNISLDISPRERKLMLKKFELVLKTLSEIHKNNIFLSLILINYFIYQEIGIKFRTTANKSLSFNEWFKHIWFQGEYDLDYPLDNAEEVRYINCLIDNFDKIICAIYLHLEKNKEQFLNVTPRDFRNNFKMFQAKCKNSLGYDDCSNCEGCSSTIGKNGVIYNGKHLKNLHSGLEIKRYNDGTCSIALPLEDKYFTNNKYITGVLEWCEGKYNFVSSME